MPSFDILRFGKGGNIFPLCPGIVIALDGDACLVVDKHAPHIHNRLLKG